jgi:hypothetical protein
VVVVVVVVVDDDDEEDEDEDEDDDGPAGCVWVPGAVVGVLPEPRGGGLPACGQAMNLFRRDEVGVDDDGG